MSNAIQKKANGFDCATPLDSGKLKKILSDTLNEVGKIKYSLRYLSANWKGVTKKEIQAIHDKGLALFLFYETLPTKDAYFTEKQGKQDAENALKLAKKIDLPKHVGVCYTVDEATQDFKDILVYFKAIKKADNGYPIGAYGDYNVIQFLQKHGVCDFYIQTYAWSGDKIADSAVYQFKDAQTLGGVSVDLDAVSDDKYAWKPDPTTKATVQTQPYHIQSGETFWRLENRWNLEHRTLEKLNPGVNVHYLQKGQAIKIPAHVHLHHSKPKSKPADDTYTVQKGDTLDGIAYRFNTTESELLKLNPNITNPNVIDVGEKITLPGGAKYHTVQSGETLWGIAQKNHISLARLEKLNPQIKNPDQIDPGEKVRIS